MFTGIIQAVGEITGVQTIDGDSRLIVDCGALSLAGMKEGDSLAINGVCLTMLSIQGGQFEADVSAETLKVTSLGHLKVGSCVNLEPALKLSDGIHGHIVSGHVDATAQVVSIAPDARSTRWRFSLPNALRALVAPKGSIAIDGVSLTVNEVEGDEFGVNIIPHTMNNTLFQSYRTGSVVNLEADMLARYAARLLEVMQSEKT